MAETPFANDNDQRETLVFLRGGLRFTHELNAPDSLALKRTNVFLNRFAQREKVSFMAVQAILWGEFTGRMSVDAAENFALMPNLEGLVVMPFASLLEAETADEACLLQQRGKDAIWFFHLTEIPTWETLFDIEAQLGNPRLRFQYALVREDTPYVWGLDQFGHWKQSLLDANLESRGY